DEVGHNALRCEVLGIRVIPPWPGDAHRRRIDEFAEQSPLAVSVAEERPGVADRVGAENQALGFRVRPRNLRCPRRATVAALNGREPDGTDASRPDLGFEERS